MYDIKILMWTRLFWDINTTGYINIKILTCTMYDIKILMWTRLFWDINTTGYINFTTLNSDLRGSATVRTTDGLSVFNLPPRIKQQHHCNPSAEQWTIISSLVVSATMFNANILHKRSADNNVLPAATFSKQRRRYVKGIQSVGFHHVITKDMVEAIH